MRRIFVSRSSFEKPRPFERFVRTSSPSSTSTLIPSARNCGTSSRASVVLPAPDKPVNQTVKPILFDIKYLHVQVDDLSLSSEFDGHVPVPRSVALTLAQSFKAGFCRQQHNLCASGTTGSSPAFRSRTLPPC